MALGAPTAAVASAERLVRVFDCEPDLLEGVSPTAARHLRRRAAVRAFTLEPGDWRPPFADGAPAGLLGLLVIEGILVRELTVRGRDASELVSTGDVLRPWDDWGYEDLGTDDCAWRVAQRAEVAVLDRRFAELVGRHPEIVSALLSRMLLRSRALAFLLATAGVRSAGSRLLLLLWHLADRWGRVRADGVLVPMCLTHELLARLTRLRRPTASAALADLARQGRLSRTAEGHWLLLGQRPTLGDPAPAALP